MTADEYRTAISDLGLTQLGAGRWLGISKRTAQKFAADGPSPPAARAIQMLRMMTPGQATRFLKVSHPSAFVED